MLDQQRLPELDLRRTFWRQAWPLLRSGRLEALIHPAIVSHHLIQFTRDCLSGRGESSFHAPGAEAAPDRDAE